MLEKIKKSCQVLFAGMAMFSLLFFVHAQNNGPAAAEDEVEVEADDINPEVDPRDIFGYWNMYDFGSRNRVGIIYFYEYEGKVYGRMMAEFDKKSGEMLDNYTVRKSTAPHIPGHPPVQGYDVMWGLEWSEKKHRWINGRILDPRRKKPYVANAWRISNDEMKMRGGIPFMNLGLSIVWDKCPVEDIPASVPLFREGTLTPRVYFDDFKVLQNGGYIPGQPGDPLLEETTQAADAEDDL
jgi:uncharacterized protein (DUF2147 family)